MLIRCIDNADIEDRLTVGKIYESRGHDDQMVDIINDRGEADSFVIGRFEEVEE